MTIRPNTRREALIVVGILAACLLGYGSSASATVTPAGVSLEVRCSADGSSASGAISGVGMTPGEALNSAVLFGTTVVAQDTTRKRAASDGTYQSEQLTLERGSGFTVQITDAQTGNPVATTTANVECFRPPSDTSTSSRNCATHTVTGTVTGDWLGNTQFWDLEYNSVTISRNFSGENGRPTTFPFTVQGVPASTVELDIKLVDTSPSPTFSSIPARVSLTHCAATASSPTPHPTSKAAASSTASSSTGLSTSPAAKTSSSSSHAAVVPVLLVSPGAAATSAAESTSAPVSTPPAQGGRKSSSHTGLLIALLIVLVVGGFGATVVGWSRRRPAR